MSASLRASIGVLALGAILTAAALWWERGATILLEIGAAVAACF